MRTFQPVLNCSVVSNSLQPFGLWLTMGFFKQEYWSELPFPCPRDLSNLGIEPMSPVSLALQADSLPTEPLRNILTSKGEEKCPVEPGVQCRSRLEELASCPIPHGLL